MQLKFISLMVSDQDHALRFYTEVVGFTKMADIPMGTYRWLTVSSPDGCEGVELVLEPMAFAPARTFQAALYEAGVPATALITKDIAADHARLTAAGVKFKSEPQAMGPVTMALFDDTCGNWINLVQPH